MSVETRYAAYDPYARIYNEYLGEKLSLRALPPLEKLLFPYLPKEALILDLCCGSGHLAHQLTLKGYKVTGLDGSESMLHHARENAPAVKFILGDARFFEFPCTFDGIISMSDSLNHVMHLDELIRVFQNVYTSLRDNGLFVFDLNLEKRCQSAEWHGSLVGDIQDEYAWAGRRSYHPEDRIAKTQITIFHLVEGSWQRVDPTLLARCYSVAEVQSALEKVGFTEVSVYDAQRDFDIHDWGVGKAYFVGRK